MTYVISLVIHEENDAIDFNLIWSQYDGLERSELHPGGVQQVKFIRNFS